MKERLEIQNESVRLMRLNPDGRWIVELELPLEPYLDRLASELAASHPRETILPYGCRWYDRRQRAEALILEEPPSTRRIRFAARRALTGDEAPEESFDLAFPYVIYAFIFLDGNFEEMKIFYRPAPLLSRDDELYLSNLFNVQLSRGHRAHNRACLRPKPDVRGFPLAQQTEKIINHFWNTEFNQDVEDSGFHHYVSKHPEMDSLSRWEKESLDDPLFVLRFPWETAGTTLGDLITGLLEQTPFPSEPLRSTGSLADLCYRLMEEFNEPPEFDHRLGAWKK